MLCSEGRTGGEADSLLFFRLIFGPAFALPLFHSPDTAGEHRR
jgi:hypothetical protein